MSITVLLSVCLQNKPRQLSQQQPGFQFYYHHKCKYNDCKCTPWLTECKERCLCLPKQKASTSLWVRLLLWGRVSTAWATAQQVLHFASPLLLSSDLVHCQERDLLLFFLLMCLLGAQLSYHLTFTQANNQPTAGNDSDLLINFRDLEQRLPDWLRASAHAETVPNIYLGNIYSPWNWWEN